MNFVNAPCVRSGGLLQALLVSAVLLALPFESQAQTSVDVPLSAINKMLENQLKFEEALNARALEALRTARDEWDKGPQERSNAVILKALETAHATGRQMPDYFAYQFGEVLYRAGAFEESLEWTERYLNEFGATARYAVEASVNRTFAQEGLDEFRQRFVWHDKAAGEIRDVQTGLIWGACNSVWGLWEGRWCSGAFTTGTWDEVVTYAKALAKSTGQPWRLPTPEELQEVSAYFPLFVAGFWTWTSQEIAGDKAVIAHEYFQYAQRSGSAPLSDAPIDNVEKARSLPMRLVR